MSKWPDTTQEDMWPFDLQISIIHPFIRINKIPLISYLPAKMPHGPFRIFEYLDVPLMSYKDKQDGKGISKWKACLWTGIYVGSSNCHSSNIPLIYNPPSTHLSSQLHVIFDESFHTATGDINTTHSSYFERLHNSSANWIHNEKFTNQAYTFSSVGMRNPTLLQLPLPHINENAAIIQKNVLYPYTRETSGASTFQFSSISF
jgi:hypothetical protein